MAIAHLGTMAQVGFYQELALSSGFMESSPLFRLYYISFLINMIWEPMNSINHSFKYHSLLILIFSNFDQISHVFRL